MVYHDWGDADFKFWKEIDLAGDYIANILVRYGRVPVRDVKEKYGTLRIYLSLGWHSLHCIAMPRYVYTQWGPVMQWIDYNIGWRVVPKLNFLIVPYHKWLYRFAYKRAVAKWPMIRAEILACADYHELLGGL